MSLTQSAEWPAGHSKAMLFAKASASAKPATERLEHAGVFLICLDIHPHQEVIVRLTGHIDDVV